MADCNSKCFIHTRKCNPRCNESKSLNEVITMEYQYKNNDSMLRRLIRVKTLRPSPNETLLLAFSLEHQQQIPIFSDFPFVVDYEYELKQGLMNHGKGDLILTNGNKKYLVVEAKHITQAEGRNARARRRQQRNKVNEQVTFYLDKFLEKYPNADADGFALTNEILSEDLLEKYEIYRNRQEKIWSKRKKSLYPKTKKKQVI